VRISEAVQGSVCYRLSPDGSRVYGTLARVLPDRVLFTPGTGASTGPTPRSVLLTARLHGVLPNLFPYSPFGDELGKLATDLQQARSEQARRNHRNQAWFNAQVAAALDTRRRKQDLEKREADRADTPAPAPREPETAEAWQ